MKTSLISVAFWLIAAMSDAMQDPFENYVTDTPILALSRTIEINLRQQLDESKLPGKIQPEDGVLM
jgi:putative membrane protein